MALNIGNVNFGVDATTTGLKKSIAALERFQKKTNAVAKSQAKGANAVVSAMVRQESAIKRAFQQTKNLQQQLKKAGAPAQDIAKVSLAFKKLTNEMTSGNLKMKEFTRSSDAFAAKMGRVKRTLKDIQKTNATNALKKNASAMRNMETAAVLAVGPLSGIGARLRAITVISSRTTIGLAALTIGLAGVAFGLAKIGANAIRVSAAMGAAQARFEAVTGSVQIAKREMQFIINVSRKLGLGIEANARSFSRFIAAAQGTALEGEKARKVFVGFAKAGAALRLTNDEMIGIFRALEQMMSKGVVQAEELRGQLGDRLPGALRLMADALGVDTIALQKMMKEGRLLSDEVIPKMAAHLDQLFGSSAKDNVNSYQGAVNEVGNAYDQFSLAVDEATGLSDTWIATMQQGTRIMDNMRFMMINVGFVAPPVSTAIEKIGDAAGGAAEPLGSITKVFEKLNKEMVELEARSKLLGKVNMAAMMTGEDPRKQLLPLFQAIEDVEKLSGKELHALAENLDVTPTIAAVARAVAQQRIKVREAELAVQALGDAWDEAAKDADKAAKLIESNAKKVMDAFKRQIVQSVKLSQNVRFEIEALSKRNTAILGGVEAYEKYTKVTAIIDKLRVQLEKSVLPLETQKDLLERMEFQLMANLQIQKQASQVGIQMGNAMANSFESIIFGAKSAKDAVKDLIKEMLRLMVRNAIINPFLSSLGTALKIPLISGARAGGGPVHGGGSFLIGEDGPELFTPKVSGNITSNQSLGKAVKASKMAANDGRGSITVIQHNDFSKAGSIDNEQLVQALRTSKSETIAAVQNLQRRKRF